MANEIKNITSEGFRKYGYVIAHDSNDSRSFQVVLTECAQVGWRIAVSRITDKTISVLGRHPNSMESFEPVTGTTIICVAEPEKPEDYEVFLLDKPVCLFKNTWHAVLCLSEYSCVKITENADVNSETHKLGKSIKLMAVECV